MESPRAAANADVIVEVAPALAVVERLDDGAFEVAEHRVVLEIAAAREARVLRRRAGRYLAVVDPLVDVSREIEHGSLRGPRRAVTGGHRSRGTRELAVRLV